MKLSEWLQADDIAILHIAVYYGIPALGHKNCYKHIEPSQHPVQHVKASDIDTSIMRCSGCGKLLLHTDASR